MIFSSVVSWNEIPYDFYRKRLSMLVADQNQVFLISKGALDNVLAVCSHLENPDGSLVAIDEVREQIQQRYLQYSQQGLRTLGLAYKAFPVSQTGIDKQDEADLRFLGFLTFFDLPKTAVYNPFR